MKEENEYRIVSVRLTKEEANKLQAIVQARKSVDDFYRMSNLLRAIVSEWLEAHSA